MGLVDVQGPKVLSSSKIARFWVLLLTRAWRCLGFPGVRMKVGTSTLNPEGQTCESAADHKHGRPV